MNLSKIDNQLLVARNWNTYKNKIVIPQELRNKIEIVESNYDQRLLTLVESNNQILDILNSFYSKKK